MNNSILFVVICIHGWYIDGWIVVSIIGRGQDITLHLPIPLMTATYINRYTHGCCIEFLDGIQITVHVS
jgi:hypothetical protein